MVKEFGIYSGSSRNSLVCLIRGVKRSVTCFEKDFLGLSFGEWVVCSWTREKAGRLKLGACWKY